jgi:hypothetical protein
MTAAMVVLEQSSRPTCSLSNTPIVGNEARWDVLTSIDFTTIEAWTKNGLVNYYLLFAMEVATRRVNFAGCTANPDEPDGRCANDVVIHCCDFESAFHYSTDSRSCCRWSTAISGDLRRRTAFSPSAVPQNFSPRPPSPSVLHLQGKRSMRNRFTKD